MRLNGVSLVEKYRTAQVTVTGQKQLHELTSHRPVTVTFDTYLAMA